MSYHMDSGDIAAGVGPPAHAKQGDLFYDRGSGRVICHDGTDWLPFDAAQPPETYRLSSEHGLWVLDGIDENDREAIAAFIVENELTAVVRDRSVVLKTIEDGVLIKLKFKKASGSAKKDHRLVRPSISL